jgi:hypothetical protein
MVAIPLPTDQPGVGARLAWTGTGEVIPLARLGTTMLRAAIKQVLTQDSYKKMPLGYLRLFVEQVESVGLPILLNR